MTYAEVMPARASAAAHYTLTSHPEAPPVASPAPPGPVDRDSTPPALSVQVGPARRSSLSGGGSLAVSVTLSEPGTATVSVLLGRASAGKATLNLPHGGLGHTSLKLSRAARKSLARHTSLTVIVKALDNAGNPARKSLTVSLS